MLISLPAPPEILIPLTPTGHPNLFNVGDGAASPPEAPDLSAGMSYRRFERYDGASPVNRFQQYHETYTHEGAR